MFIFGLMCKEESDKNKDKPTNPWIGGISMILVIVCTGSVTPLLSEVHNLFVWVSSFVNAIVYIGMYFLYTRVIVKKLKYGDNVCDGDGKNRMKHANIFSGIVLGPMIVSTLAVYAFLDSQKSKRQNVDRSTDENQSLGRVKTLYQFETPPKTDMGPPSETSSETYSGPLSETSSETSS